jgi:hypothetical protein
MRYIQLTILKKRKLRQRRWRNFFIATQLIRNQASAQKHTMEKTQPLEKMLLEKLSICM